MQKDMEGAKGAIERRRKTEKAALDALTVMCTYVSTRAETAGSSSTKGNKNKRFSLQKHFLYESLKITLCSFFAFLYICGCSFSVFAAILTKLKKKKNKNASRCCAGNKLNRQPSRKRKMK